MLTFFSLAAVFLISLGFLAILFGDRLSLFGLKNVEWLTAPIDLLSWFWGMVCELADRIWCGIMDQFWWVLAASAGSIGMLLIALMLITGLTEEAQAIRTDRLATMNVGGVLNAIPRINPQRVLQANLEIDPAARAENHAIYQMPSPGYRPPVFRDPLPTRPLRPADNLIVEDFPPIETPAPRYRGPYRRQKLSVTLEPFTEIAGRPTGERERMVELAVRDLNLRDDWRIFSGRRRDFNDPTFDTPVLREDTLIAENRLIENVRIIPGDFVTSTGLTVEKTAPENPLTNEFDIQIRVTNETRERVDGVIVREILPVGWEAISMQPQSVYRSSTATWLIDSLPPGEERLMSIRVRAGGTGDFDSYTEVSAAAAVTAPFIVEPESRPIPPVREPLRYPDVRLYFDPQPTRAKTEEWFTVLFDVSNFGTIDATGVTLTIELPRDFDHKVRRTQPDIRLLRADLARLAPNEERQLNFRARALKPGRYEVKARLLMQDKELYIDTFKIDVGETSGTPTRPDNSGGFDDPLSTFEEDIPADQPPQFLPPVGSN